ncbi:MAG TPA: RluA family pseudouridine synthase [Chitinophagaceae bacterium]|nr:RluA family pseudouridine synthase [Chitinophagaceae bacterium]HPH30942.1 RluA family pseudouridine synthase [Chitinophagaceae bacterium]HPN57836.1 RluA family pseudouridine synthase [Chitinophagaceae bacterium]
MNLKDSIIAETENWVAINKPSGLLSIPDREGKEVSLKVLLKEKYGEIFTVHRIDRDTSGLIVFAKNESAHKHLCKQFEDRHTKKIYQGLVIGSPAQPAGSIEAPLMEHPGLNGTMIVHRKGKEALTDYEVLTDFGIFSHVQFRIHTGRTHQIRVHMKDLGYPIVCDPLYGDGKPLLLSAVKSKFKLSKNELEERPILGRLALHAFQLSFTDIDGNIVDLEAPLHKDMRATLQQLAKRKKK